MKKLLAILPLLLAIALVLTIVMMSFVKSRSISPHNTCINNLRMIDSGKESWSLANSKHVGDQPDVAEINHYIKGDTTPECPAGGVYSYNPVGTDPTCSITSPVPHRLPKLK